jgi:flagellar biosynthesis protein FliP
MKEVSTNKWIRFALSLATTILGFLAAYNWSQLVDAKTAGLIVMAIGIVKMIIDAVALDRVLLRFQLLELVPPVISLPISR